MTLRSTALPKGSATGRALRGVRRPGVLPLVAAGLALGLAGCSASSAASPAALTGAAPGAGQPTRPSPGQLTAAPSPGAYPVATPPAEVRQTPLATPGGYQLVAAGVPVRVEQADGSAAVVQVMGPNLRLASAGPTGPVQHAQGVLTVTATSTAGAVDLKASSFLALDQKQHRFPLHADVATATATPGSPATIRLSADFDAGHTTLTWQPAGRPLVTWDFVVELD